VLVLLEELGTEISFCFFASSSAMVFEAMIPPTIFI